MLRDSLSALLGTIPEVNVVSVANDLDSALEYVSEYQPMVCILDLYDHGEEQMMNLDHMKSISPEMKIIALVDEVKVKEVAESIGFDEVVIKGVSAEKLVSTITDCIQESIKEVEKSNN